VRLAHHRRVLVALSVLAVGIGIVFAPSGDRAVTVLAIGAVVVVELALTLAALAARQWKLAPRARVMCCVATAAASVTMSRSSRRSRRAHRAPRSP
jgi:hypothetical protein